MRPDVILFIKDQNNENHELQLKKNDMHADINANVHIPISTKPYLTQS